MNSLIGQDIEILRTYYDEALELQGIPCKYQYPLMATSNEQGEAVVDSYSDMINTHIVISVTRNTLSGIPLYCPEKWNRQSFCTFSKL